MLTTGHKNKSETEENLLLQTLLYRILASSQKIDDILDLYDVPI